MSKLHMLARSAALCLLLLPCFSFAQSTESRYFGAIKLQCYDRPELYVVQQDQRALTLPSPLTTISIDGQWILVPGLADLSQTSFESVNFRGQYLTQEGDRLFLRPDSRNFEQRARATFRRSTVKSFTGTVSFESLVTPGQYISRLPESNELGLRALVSIDDLKAASFVELLPNGNLPSQTQPPLIKIVLESVWFPGFVLRVTGPDIRPVLRKDVLPAEDAVFIQRPGLAGGGSISFESSNRPGYFMRQQQGRMVIAAMATDEAFRKDASFNRGRGLASDSGFSYQSVANPTLYIGVNGFYETYLTFVSNDVDRKLVTFFERAP